MIIDMILLIKILAILIGIYVVLRNLDIIKIIIVYLKDSIFRK